MELVEKFMQEKKYDQVIQGCGDLLQANDTRTDVYFYTGKAKFLKNQYRLAYNDLKLFTDDDTNFANFAEGYYYLGLSQLKLNQTVEGCEFLKTALNLGFADAETEVIKHCK